ncbi:MAG: hypothetical protein ACE5LU_21650 [Anaerolineae bacterium]
MDHQTPVKAQQSQTAQIEISDDGLEARVARLEAEVSALQEALNRLVTPSEGPAFRFFREVVEKDPAYAWVEPPAHLKGVTDYSQLEPEDLVYIHELTDEDVRLRLEQLERWYGMSSEEFYERWQQGEADDIFDKTEWSILYEHWLEVQARPEQSLSRALSRGRRAESADTDKGVG